MLLQMSDYFFYTISCSTSCYHSCKDIKHFKYITFHVQNGTLICNGAFYLTGRKYEEFQAKLSCS